MVFLFAFHILKLDQFLEMESFLSLFWREWKFPISRDWREHELNITSLKTGLVVFFDKKREILD